MMDGSDRLLSKLAPAVEACEAFHSQKYNQTPFRQQAHRLHCVAERGKYGKAHLQR